MNPPPEDEQFYARVVEELTQQGPIPGLWAKAFSECDGSENRAKALYMRLRVNQLSSLDTMARARAENVSRREREQREAGNQHIPPKLSKKTMKIRAMLLAGFLVFVPLLFLVVSLVASNR